jgi:hypothetical protein
MFAATKSEPDITTLLTAVKSKPLNNFKEAFPSIRDLVLEIANRCERVLQVHGIDQKNEQPYVLPPPRYIMMWDIIGSTEQEDRNTIEPLIVDVNRRIKETIGDRIQDFHADSKDDGNGFICEHFTDALTAFQLLNENFHGYRFRAGCDVNLQGQLNYYPKSKTLGGRAYEYAARVMAFFKEIRNSALWSGASIPSESAETSYMTVSEFAKRYAQEEGAWPTSGTYIVNELGGRYKARVNASLPMSLTILQPLTAKLKSVGNTKQQELL